MKLNGRQRLIILLEALRTAASKNDEPKEINPYVDNGVIELELYANTR